MVFASLIQLITEVFDTEKRNHENQTNVMDDVMDDAMDDGMDCSKDYDPVTERYKILNFILRNSGLWPAIQVKKFFDRSGLVLLYNAYKNAENEKITELPIFKETRSVVIQMGAETPEQAIVSSVSNELPVRMTDMTYENLKMLGDVLETGFEGTMFHVYHHNYKWYFSTTTCPNINSSRYFHPTKTHGEMLDEALLKLFPDTEMDLEQGTEGLSLMRRARFTAHLDTSRSYMFVLIHHENRHLIDYTPLFGNEYKHLLHISTRYRNVEIPVQETRPLSGLGVLYPIRFDTTENGLNWLRSIPSNYALIVKRADGSILKVCREETVFQEETDLGNANPWHNMLWIYLKNRPDFNVAQYAKDKQYQAIRTESGKFLSPTFVIHTVVSTMSAYLYNLYYASTYYNIATKHLVFKAKVDKEHAPILRFHMVQLREIQKNSQPDRLLTPKMITDYLRYHQTMKNIRMLIAHFAKNPMNGMTDETKFCFVKLYEVLADREKH